VAFSRYKKIYEKIVTLLNNLFKQHQPAQISPRRKILAFIENREGLGGLKPIVGRIFCMARLDNMKGVGVTRLLGLVLFRAVNSLTVDSNECSFWNRTSAEIRLLIDWLRSVIDQQVIRVLVGVSDVSAMDSIFM